MQFNALPPLIGNEPQIDCFIEQKSLFGDMI